MMVERNRDSSADGPDVAAASNRGWSRMTDVVLVAVGTVLVVAAILKVYAVLTGQMQGSYATILEALMEMAAGFWCWCGAWRQWAWRAVVVFFLIFAGVSLLRGLEGHPSCGCFGTVQVNPWWTLALDVGVLGALLAGRPPQGSVPPATQLRIRGTGLLLLVLFVAGGWVVARNRPAWLHANGTITGGAGTVLMDPVGWTHHRLPLLKYMPNAQVYSNGRWLVVLYHHGCEVCWQAIGQVAAKLAAAQHPHHVLLIQVPPDGPLPASLHTRGMVEGEVDFGRNWAIRMFPLYLDMHNGVVTRVRIYAKGYWSGF